MESRPRGTGAPRSRGRARAGERTPRGCSTVDLSEAHGSRASPARRADHLLPGGSRRARGAGREPGRRGRPRRCRGRVAALHHVAEGGRVRPGVRRQRLRRHARPGRGRGLRRRAGRDRDPRRGRVRRRARPDHRRHPAPGRGQPAGLDPARRERRRRAPRRLHRRRLPADARPRDRHRDHAVDRDRQEAAPPGCGTTCCSTAPTSAPGWSRSRSRRAGRAGCRCATCSARART